MMPPKKRQRTGKDSSAATQEREEEREEHQPEAESSTARDQADENEDNDDELSDTNTPKLRDTKTIPEYEYVGMHRPLFDYKVERRTRDDPEEEDEEEDEEESFHSLYRNGFDAENKAGVMLEPAKDHRDHKWCIMWAGYKMFMDYRRRANYCSPDAFGMDIYNDFEGWGFQELIENFIVEFDKSLKKNDDEGLKHTWAIVSAMALWINEVDQGPLMGNEDGEKTEAVIGLVGWALIRGLAALDFADHLNPETDFFDIPIVITALLEFSKGLPDYGIEGEAVSWRPHAVAYFKKGKFTNHMGILNTEALLESAKGGTAAELAKKGDKDPWGWRKLLGAYKKKHGTGKGGASIGGTKYDITKMSRKERASYAYDGKDPLADISDKDLKEGNLDLA